MKMTAAPIKREFPCKASVRLRDGTRNPVTITAQHLDFVWIQVNSPTGWQNFGARRESVCSPQSYLYNEPMMCA